MHETNEIETPETRARHIVDAMATGAFERVVESFDDTMRSALPAPKLRETWDGLLASVGPLKACADQPKTEKQGVYVRVSVTCRFERASLDALVVLDASSRVAGLFFKPTPAAYAAPAYVHADAFEERDVTVNPGPWALPGVLTLPREGRPVAAVVLVHGSGPNDRDETIGANKPFRDLAAGLASQGVAVLRYDKRTLVHGKAMAASATLTVAEESVDDAVSAAALLRTLPEIDRERVFVAGHSLGGELVPRIGKRDPKLAGLIVLAGSTRPMGPVMVEQLKYILGLDEVTGATREIPPDGKKKIAEVEKTWARIVQIQGGAKHEANEMLLGAPPSYWIDLTGYDAPALAKTLPQPIYVAQGGRDYQVTLQDFARWKAALGTKKGATLKLYPALSHILGRGEGKSSPAEYQKSTPVDEELVRDLAAWIKGRGT